MKITFDIEVSDKQKINDAIEVLRRLLSTVPIPLTVKDLGIDNRALNCLKAEKIETVEDLMEWTANDLLKTPNLGRKSLNEIKEKLLKAGYYMREQ